MLSLLVSKEIRAHVLSYRFAVSFILLFVLIVSSVQLIALNYDRQLAGFAESQRAQKEKLAEGTDFRSFQWSGYTVDRRPNPLSVFAMGLEKEMARSVTVSGFAESKLGRSKYPNPLFVLFPAPDLLYIVNIVASLLAILFAFDAVCGEQEEGTLKLLMANSVPRHLVLLAKWIGGYIALIVPFLLSLGVALFFALLTTDLSFTGSEWARLGAMVAVSALYISVFYLLGLMVSTLVHRSATSLVVNFLVWVLLVLVVPNTAPIVARAIAPVPSAGVLGGQRQAIQRSAWEGMRPQRGQRLSNEERQKRLDETQARVRDQTAKLVSDYMQRVDRQISVGVVLARFSPSASYVYATAGLAGAGLDSFGDLRQYIQRYREEFSSRVREIAAARQRQAESAADASERQEIMNAPVVPDDLPRFSPGGQSLGLAITSGQVDLVVLLLLNVGFFLGAYSGFLRYDLMK